MLSIEVVIGQPGVGVGVDHIPVRPGVGGVRGEVPVGHQATSFQTREGERIAARVVCADRRRPERISGPIGTADRGRRDLLRITERTGADADLVVLVVYDAHEAAGERIDVISHDALHGRLVFQCERAGWGRHNDERRGRAERE